MEVHAHSHTPPSAGSGTGKKWTHYFWEFFMLFLAVTLGFFVENRREHYIEGKREKQYIRSLVQDLKADTAYLKNAVEIQDLSCRMTDTLLTLLKSENPAASARNIYYLARMIPFRDQAILVHDKTFEQLKNSGSLRLVHKQMVLDSISAYYEQYKWISAGPSLMQLRNRQELFLGLDKLFDMAVFQQMLQTDDPFTPVYPAGEPVLLTTDKEVINAVCARYHFMYGIKKVLRKVGQDLLETAGRLIALLQAEYHLS